MNQEDDLSPTPEQVGEIAAAVARTAKTFGCAIEMLKLSTVAIVIQAMDHVIEDNEGSEEDALRGIMGHVLDNSKEMLELCAIVAREKFPKEFRKIAEAGLEKQKAKANRQKSKHQPTTRKQ